MCGIAGVIRFGERDRDAEGATREVARMTAAIAHRGPDGQGVLVREGVALGHRRLSIIDLEGGAQPMSNEDGGVWVVFNGEIYNFAELRAELAAEGHTFRTRSDTEAIVHGYEAWGDACVDRLRGMFAFAVADFRARRVLLARDPFGIKPLLYRRGPGYFAFASELAALRAVDGPPPKGRLQALDYFLRYRYIPDPDTIFADTWKLPPAHTLAVGFDGKAETPRRYWDLRFPSRDSPAAAPPAGDWTAHAEGVIRESVAAHLVSDVPFGVFLSGGIDSTVIAGEMRRLLPGRVLAFTIGFGEEGFSEVEAAKDTAARLGLEHVAEVVREDASATLRDLVAHYGEPFADSSAIPTWYVSRLARRHVPMVLSGDGGDEGFGGYRSYEAWLGHGRAAGLRGVALRAAAAGRRWARGRTDPLSRWLEITGVAATELRGRLWRRGFRGLVATPQAAFAEADAAARGFDRLGYAQALDFRTYLPGDILAKVDVASMAHGLEVRPPLIDRRVVEMAAKMPLAERFAVDPRWGPVGKPILKRLAARHMPEAAVYRPKQGFSIPLARWLGPGRPFRAMLDRVALGPRSPLAEWFEPDAVRRLVEGFGRRPHLARVLWLLLVLGLWREQNPDVVFDRDSP